MYHRPQMWICVKVWHSSFPRMIWGVVCKSLSSLTIQLKDGWNEITHANAVYFVPWHYIDVIMGTIASHIASVSIVCSTICSGSDQRKHQSSTLLAFVRGIHRWPVDSPHKGWVTRNMFQFDDGIMMKQFWYRSILPISFKITSLAPG